MKKEDFLKEQESFDNEMLSEKDMEIYALIFKELKEDKSPEIPMDFSVRVAQQGLKKRHVLEDVKWYAFYSILFVLLLFMAFTFFSFGSSDILSKSFAMIPFMGYGVAGALVYFLVQSLDRWLIRDN